jgi:hypothetical protein
VRVISKQVELLPSGQHLQQFRRSLELEALLPLEFLRACVVIVLCNVQADDEQMMKPRRRFNRCQRIFLLILGALIFAVAIGSIQVEGLSAWKFQAAMFIWGTLFLLGSALGRDL